MPAGFDHDPIVENFESAAYAVRIHGADAWYVLRKHDRARTTADPDPRFREYKKLKSIWRKKRADFDAVCATFTYEPRE